MNQPMMDPEACAVGHSEAAKLLDLFIRGGNLPAYYPPGIVLQPGEFGLGEAVANWDEFTELEYEYRSERSMFAWGSPAFVAGALIANAIGEAADRREAQRLAALAAAQWRWQGQPRLVLTNQRLLVQHTTRGWASFWHGALVGFLPQVEGFLLLLDYADCAPVRIWGPMVPWLSVALASCIYPRPAMAEMPVFQVLRSGIVPGGIVPGTIVPAGTVSPQLGPGAGQPGPGTGQPGPGTGAGQPGPGISQPEAGTS